jgi:hypothetical protein
MLLRPKVSGPRHPATNMLGTRESTAVEPTTFTKGDAIAVLWEIAAKAPEDTRGSLAAQVKACKLMYAMGYDRALKRLSELSGIDGARTKGHRRGQESAERLLKRLVSSIKVDKNQETQ